MAIVFEHIDKAFGKLEVLRDFSLELPERGVVVLSGPSGCGKTTLGRLLIGLDTPDKGSISGLEGRRAVCVFQENRLLPWASALENAALGGEEGPARLWLERLGMRDFMQSYPAQLSGGMQRRVAVARALAASADVFVLDEPFTGLDDENQRLVLSAIHERMGDALFVIITHDLSNLRELSGEMLYLEGPPLRVVKKGRIQE